MYVTINFTDSASALEALKSCKQSTLVIKDGSIKLVLAEVKVPDKATITLESVEKVL